MNSKSKIKSPKLPAPLTGIVPPMITPLRDSARLDEDAIPGIVGHLVRGGVSAIFILGTTGEGPRVAANLRRELIRAVCREAYGKIPVLVGITDTSIAESVGLAEFAASCGASATVLAPPPYFTVNQDELVRMTKHLVRYSALPLLLYNMPSHTKTFIELSTVQRLADLPGVAGLKDSSGDMVFFHKVRTAFRDRPDFTLLVGPEELLAESVLFGGHGGVSGGANLVPRLYVELYRAAKKGDIKKARELHEKVMLISSSLYGTGYSSVAMIAGLKYAMELAGICKAHLCEPFAGFAKVEESRLRKNYEALEPTLRPFQST